MSLKPLCDLGLIFFLRWACDDTVTHYIYQGRVGDNTREYRGVKERGLHVVSQCWLQAVCFVTFELLCATILFIYFKCMMCHPGKVNIIVAQKEHSQHKLNIRNKLTITITVHSKNS